MHWYEMHNHVLVTNPAHEEVRLDAPPTTVYSSDAHGWQNLRSIVFPIMDLLGSEIPEELHVLRDTSRSIHAVLTRHDV
ncbi:hypothetical protein LIER_24525 [Lithospermum erythrorhizon]|uniref:Uncharacterized protein n=1 Tax=Lithospermum erythrorhizon TaxID=34254 RepID=A0AAV3R7A2_LITER